MVLCAPRCCVMISTTVAQEVTAAATEFSLLRFPVAVHALDFFKTFTFCYEGPCLRLELEV